MRRVKEKVKVAPAVLNSLSVYCPVLDKEISLLLSDVSFGGSESECEMCGSHGSVTLSIYKCQCGGMHDIVLKEW